jgi:HD-like signal output (HDOD) protein
VIRVLLFIVIVGALALMVVSMLRRTPREGVDRPRAAVDDDTGERRALPAPADYSERGLSRAATMHLFHELAFGAPLEPNVPAEHVRVAMAVASTLQTVAGDPKYAPRRPLLLPELVRAVNDSDTTRRDLAQMIARDPALVGSLLKLANSPIYRRGSQPIESLERALAVLGTQGTRSLVAAALLQPVFRANGDSAQFAELVWEHTQRSAAAAELHAAAVEASDPFSAQLVALVMGLGAIVVYRCALDEYAARNLSLEPAAVASLLEEQAPKVARQIAASWELSERVLDALDEQQSQRVERPPSALGRSLRFGTWIGALSVLRSYGRVDDDAGAATLATAGGVGERFERLWGRLTWPEEERA